ncbi:thioredoxin domain-containing protein [Sulfuriferula sp.]|uniref:thioredoxin domain-containing protein n=1 Tax=Sulfuriferula sp. TaxID=2025307 RepID=UPI00272F77B2|nr:thioredoxin domain-containing protein [Sulfuriferula sp.]MDP2026626.1 thioredoxin domain-containing protein [Sulfuriferula sp.]
MTNRLALETSPYLQQHAENPVNWYPWGDEALRLAREQNKPILLSVGYSACHWCHVMAHESFEDAEVAAVMNEHFINIKVDREERPDLDHIYQTAHYMLTQRSGGWPLTLFLTPDQTPFFGGTYFPKQARHNLPGFISLIERVTEIYRTRQEDIAAQNASLLQAFDTTLPATPQGQASFNTAPLDDACTALQQSFDPVHGGFGSAPKFPRPTDMEFLLRYAARDGDHNARHMALHTLRKMADGGIYDQLGGGFCRYSVDERWAIPHFEKMLYDNGPLLALYTDACVLTGEAMFQRAAHGIASWVMREMQAPQGGYYSSLDADSEHEEGKFYVWTPEQVRSLLSVEEYAIAMPYYGLDQPPNFENKHWNLIVAQPLSVIAEACRQPLERVEPLLASAQQKLFAARASRVRPGRDEKILVSWNALMIKGMARAARMLDEPAWITSAQQAVDFIHTDMWQNGRLLATCKDGKAHLNAYLDDYAFMLDALLELLQAQFRLADLEFARALADVLLEQFEDSQSGGFFFTSHDHEQLIHRPKPGHDNAMPSGNGIAAFALQRLGYLLGEVRYLDAAERTLALYYPALMRQPVGYTSLLMTLQEHLTPPQIIILRSAPGQSDAWRRQLFRRYAPDKLILALEGELAGLPEALAKPYSQSVNAWICQGTQCLPPLDDYRKLLGACFHNE